MHSCHLCLNLVIPHSTLKSRVNCKHDETDKRIREHIRLPWCYGNNNNDDKNEFIKRHLSLWSYDTENHTENLGVTLKIHEKCPRQRIWVTLKIFQWHFSVISKVQNQYLNNKKELFSVIFIVLSVYFSFVLKISTISWIYMDFQCFLNFQCDFQCYNFIVYVGNLFQGAIHRYKNKSAMKNKHETIPVSSSEQEPNGIIWPEWII